VITLPRGLVAGEKIMAQTAAGAAMVRNTTRQLFRRFSDRLLQEIRRITGLEVQEADREVEAGPPPARWSMPLPPAPMVQVFQMAKRPLTAGAPSPTIGTVTVPSASITKPHVNHSLAIPPARYYKMQRKTTCSERNTSVGIRRASPGGRRCQGTVAPQRLWNITKLSIVGKDLSHSDEPGRGVL